MVTLSKRLTKVASYIKKGSYLLDIGSDHAYLPISLMEKGQIKGAIAGEVAPGPLKHSIEKIQEAGFASVIEGRLGDGFSVLKVTDPIDVVSICGMGGDLMSKILAEGAKNPAFSSIKRFVLQANVGEEELRRQISALSLKIVEETLVYEKGHVYPIIVAEPSLDETILSDKEYFMGPILLTKASSDALVLERYQRQFKHWNKVLQQLPEGHPQVLLVKVRLQWLKEVLDEIKGLNPTI
ncbi:hypothetical protein D3H64_05260 [Atopobacter sp. AH10]|uniref:tRNA (adenine(22)-N(1))-methyltransferase n=1 Tax=Atopobacter sp. AH10 TaxID=2315861 RepID=UPI000EF1CBDA|nr:tRNA (adenine(22)-N(1))-methyltransferase TrmK [Atopobacter sp. AH10]RLK63194.1 hypothetical protein D3H64_05260 [Atopobacter sp. AH10]